MVCAYRFLVLPPPFNTDDWTSETGQNSYLCMRPTFHLRETALPCVSNTWLCCRRQQPLCYRCPGHSGRRVNLHPARFRVVLIHSPSPRVTTSSRTYEAPRQSLPCGETLAMGAARVENGHNLLAGREPYCPSLFLPGNASIPRYLFPPSLSASPSRYRPSLLVAVLFLWPLHKFFEENSRKGGVCQR